VRRTDDEQPKGSSQTNTGPDEEFPWLLGFEAHRKQLLNYLRGSKIEVGLLLHFGLKARFYRSDLTIFSFNPVFAVLASVRL
jgi:hypothetical protein